MQGHSGDHAAGRDEIPRQTQKFQSVPARRLCDRTKGGKKPGARCKPRRAADDSRSSRPARERLPLIRVLGTLREQGWERARASISRAAFVALSFALGGAHPFDWSHHEVVLIGGAMVTVKVAHVRVCHRPMLFVCAYPHETQEMVFDAHDRGLPGHLHAPAL